MLPLKKVVMSLKKAALLYFGGYLAAGNTLADHVVFDGKLGT